MNIELQKNDSTVAIVESDFEAEMKTFFRTPSLLWWFLIPFGLALTFTAAVSPKVLDSQYIPYIGPFAAHLGQEMPDGVKFIAIIAFMIHIAEAVYATLTCLTYGLTVRCTVLWTLQTFILGFPSLNLLITGVKKMKQ